MFTGTRAEYGLLQGVIRGLHDSPEAALQLIVGGTHLVDRFGHTVDQIEADGWPIAARLDYLADGDSPVAISTSMGRATTLAAEAFERLRPDVLVLLGDRFEAVAVALAALTARIPIAHIHGGEITEGAMDESIRHALTKLSQLHFTATPEYRRRVLQMGENPEHVWALGALGVENIHRETLLTRDELARQVGFPLDRAYVAVTYHPVTLHGGSAAAGFRELLRALDAHPELDVVLTYPNADTGGQAIVELLEAWVAGSAGRARAVRSLGSVRYLSLMKHAAAVVGNSSSGVIEAPSLGVPTLDVGDRQKGRVAAASVVHVPESAKQISRALSAVLAPEFRERTAGLGNPYDGGATAEGIVGRLLQVDLGALARKPFFDIEVPP